MNEDDYMKDRRGAMIPKNLVKPEDLLENDLVSQLVEKARLIEADLAQFKSLAFSEIFDFQEIIAQEYGAQKGGAKGNMTLSSFDGTLEVQVQVSDHISFGPQLNAAKELIDGCVTRWSEGSNEKVHALIDHAFQVNKQGRIDTARVLGLRRLDIQDAEWKRAMDAISDAVRVTGSKTYIRFYERDPESEDRAAITLDLAKV